MNDRFFFSSRRRHTRSLCDWSSDVCSSDLITPREQQVAALVARGLSNRKIAEQLGVAQSTIQRHIVNILSKLHLESRVQIALWVVTQRSPQTRQIHLAD